MTERAARTGPAGSAVPPVVASGGDVPPVVAAEVLEVRLPLLRPFVTGSGATETRRTVLVHLVDEEGAEGWGEAAALDHPYYLPETTSSAFAVASEWALPAALGAGTEPLCVAEALSSIRGNTFARTGVEEAFWCLSSARSGVPLGELFTSVPSRLGRRSPGDLRSSVAVGESIGIQASIDATLAEVELRSRQGYRRIKLKIAPGFDVEVVRAVRELVGPDVMLQVDANGSYAGSPSAGEALAALDAFGLACIEQPLSWDDLLGHAELQARLETPICLDESLSSVERVALALRLGACRNVNLKPGRVGGLAASLEIHDLCVERGVPLWCGGMLESGIGRAFNLALAALPGFTEPADMSPASVLYSFDLVEPPYEVGPDGSIEVPRAAGLGFDVLSDRVSSQTLRRVPVQVPVGLGPPDLS